MLVWLDSWRVAGLGEGATRHRTSHPGTEPRRRGKLIATMASRSQAKAIVQAERG